ncbi:MAG TPA: sugar-binding protein, partial [Acidimicrobiales bacterium]|nr:sugar-binding protein [Acidimicrobiales bacterium]
TTSIAFVTNNASDYWTIAHKGVDKAQGELPNYKIEFVEPADGTAATQKSKLDDLVTNGVKGIAVSPVDPKDQTPDLNKYAAKALLITQDSDAPESDRACYLGTDNVEAGKMAGEALKKALPNGGKIMVFVGKADAQNAKERYEGLKSAIAGSKITILDLRTDDTDHARAKQNVADSLAKNEDLAGCVGLWSYNGPAIVNAVKEAKKVGKVQIVCFDEEDDTLAGVKDGSIFGTVVQNPFEFGYQSMKLIAKVLDGDKSAIPASKKIIIPTRFIDKSNVDDFATTLKKLRGK